MSSSGDEEANAVGGLDSLDFSGVKFPSDKLTVEALRRKHPDLFDQGFNGGYSAQPRYFFQAQQPRHAVDGVGSLLFQERLIATEAFLTRNGTNGLSDWDVDEVKQELAKSYVEYGLANGSHEAAEMIREIERQGRLLSRKRGR